MTDRPYRPLHPDRATEASVWIDDGLARILDRGIDDEGVIECLERSPGESLPAFRLRTIREIIDRDRVFVSGPAAARLTFEREHTTMTHRPDRLVDVAPTKPSGAHWSDGLLGAD